MFRRIVEDALVSPAPHVLVIDEITHHDTRHDGGITLLFAMNDLFEAYVAALLRRALTESTEAPNSWRLGKLTSRAIPEPCRIRWLKWLSNFVRNTQIARLCLDDAPVDVRLWTCPYANMWGCLILKNGFRSGFRVGHRVVDGTSFRPGPVRIEIFPHHPDEALDVDVVARR